METRRVAVERDHARAEARVAREVSGLLKSDYERLMTVLYGIEPAS